MKEAHFPLTTEILPPKALISVQFQLGTILLGHCSQLLTVTLELE